MLSDLLLTLPFRTFSISKKSRKMPKSVAKQAAQPQPHAGAARVAGVRKVHKIKHRRFKPGTRALMEIR